MDHFSRDQFLTRLDTRWRTYAERFYRLDPAEQRAYLDRQGYPSFGSLLAHVVAWWQEGAAVIAKMRADPTFPPPDYDVDTFNAQAVQKFSGMSETAMLEVYETQRQTMRDLVAGLSDADLDHEAINRRLFYEILGHWSEHALD